jgi:putative SOS response-associated peptidase YedK
MNGNVIVWDLETVPDPRPVRPRRRRPQRRAAIQHLPDIYRRRGVPTVDGPALVPMRWGLIPSWWKKTAKDVP